MAEKYKHPQRRSQSSFCSNHQTRKFHLVCWFYLIYIGCFFLFLFLFLSFFECLHIKIILRYLCFYIPLLRRFIHIFCCRLLFVCVLLSFVCFLFIFSAYFFFRFYRVAFLINFRNLLLFRLLLSFIFFRICCLNFIFTFFFYFVFFLPCFF